MKGGGFLIPLPFIKRKCNALITILETLLVPADYKVHIDDLCVKCEKVKGFMDFQDRLNIFIDVTELNTLDVSEACLQVTASTPLQT